MTTTAPPPSKRKAVYGSAAISSSQPLASAAGLHILQIGGNAADAAVAVASTLAVTEPCSNGIGGDFIALHYKAADRSVTAILGNGASPAALTPHLFGTHPVHYSSPHTITVPGAVDAWLDTKSRFGAPHLSLHEILQPAISAADEGFFVGPVTAHYWGLAKDDLRRAHNGDTYLVRDQKTDVLRAPKTGERFRNPKLANVLRNIAEQGRDAFYADEVAERIVETVTSLGGVMTKQDLVDHCTVFADPISTEYRHIKVHEVGPPTHGAVALMALNIFNQYYPNLPDHCSLDAEQAHVMIEALRLSFADAAARIADPAVSKDMVFDLFTDEHCAKLKSQISAHTKCVIPEYPPLPKGGTVQFCVIDREGNAVSAVQSNYRGFGTCHVPSGCGFTLQNRGLNFSTVPGHPNYVEGGKKPYHTIIPGMLTCGEMVCAFGVMGSFMQPQGHIQMVHAMVDRGLDAQQALDCPRFRVTGGFSSVEEGMGEDAVLVEEGIEEEVREELRKKGHVVRVGRLEDFGRGHICVRGAGGVTAAGADNRADGVAVVL